MAELKFSWIWWGLLILGSARLDAQVSARAGNRDGDFVVYARDLSIADLAVTEAERIQERFIQYFGLEGRRKKIPIVLVLGNSAWEDGAENGAFQIFANGSHAKIQVSWGALPLSLDSFTRGWVRALCIRLAAERSFLKSKGGETAEPLRVPIWVTEGIAGALMEPSLEQEISERGTLIARTERQLSLRQVLAELDGESELNPGQRALAVIFCRALMQTPDMRDRFLDRLNWNPGVTSQEWLQSILQDQEPDTWWKDVWKRQASQVSWLKLGFAKTLRWVLEWERLPSNSEKKKMYEAEIGAVGHPWFRRWGIKCASRENGEASVSEMLQFRRDIQFRRETALEWFASLDPLELQFTRLEWISWSRLHRDLKKQIRVPGPVALWFDALAYEYRRD